MAITVRQPRDRLSVVEEWQGPVGKAATVLLYTFRVWQRDRDSGRCRDFPCG